MSARRITRREMKRDEFVSGVGRFTHWVEEHVQTVLVAVGVVVVLALALFLIARFLGAREEKAAALLARGMQMVQAPVRTADSVPAPNELSYASESEKYQATLDQMNAVLETYPSSRAARLAEYYRGLALLSLGQAEEAVQTLEGFVSANQSHYMAPMAQALLARALETTGDQERALQLYRELSEAKDGVYPPQAALLEMGLCLERLEREEEAREVYERLSREYPNSDYARQADERLKNLS